MKVGIICSSVVANGGSERAVSNMTQLFAKIPDVETQVVSLCSADEDSTCFEFKAPILHIGLEALQSSMAGKVKWYAKAYRILRPIVKRHEFDVILGVGHNVSVLLPLVKSKKQRAYACEHIAYDTIPKSSQFIMTRLYPLLDGIVALSENAASKLDGLCSSTFIIPNSVPFYTCSKQAPLENKSVIMVGRLSPEKGYERMIPIAVEMKRRFPDWHIDIYGDGPMRAVIESDIKIHGLKDYVRLHGQVVDIADKYRSSSLLMLTSPSEALPMSIIEANSQGLPAIGYENEGTMALIEEGKTGFVIADGRIDCFIEKLSILLSDRNIRQRMGLASMKSVENCNPDRVRQLWASLLMKSDNPMLHKA